MNIGNQVGVIGEEMIHAAMNELGMNHLDLLWVMQNINSEESGHFFEYLEENFLEELIENQGVGNDCN